MGMPGANRRIKDLIDQKTKGKVLPFVNMLNEASQGITISHQRLNRLFDVDNRTGNWPGVPHEILEAILLRFPDVDAHWLVTGKEKSGPSTVPDHLLTQLKNQIKDLQVSLQTLDESLTLRADPGKTDPLAEGVSPVNEGNRTTT